MRYSSEDSLHQWPIKDLLDLGPPPVGPHISVSVVRPRHARSGSWGLNSSGMASSIPQSRSDCAGPADGRDGFGSDFGCHFASTNVEILRCLTGSVDVVSRVEAEG